MTGFALILWAYGQTNSAMAVSLMTFCSYLPYILVSVLAGSFVDHHRKKPVMLTADLIAALCSCLVLFLAAAGRLALWHIYAVNAVTGLMNAFQSPAASVAVGLMVDSEKYEKVSGLNSFSNSLVAVFAPSLASFVYAFGGLDSVIAVDLATFLFAFLVLLLFVPIREECIPKGNGEGKRIIRGCKEGLAFLKREKGLLYLILSFALLNFLSRLTYENTLSPMLLARTGGNQVITGLVNAFLGIGGIVGGLMVTLLPLPKNKVKMIYWTAAISFLAGDLVLGFSRSLMPWVISAFLSSLMVVYIGAGYGGIFYRAVPRDMQGRVFAVRNTLQFFTIPVGLLLGGILADRVFEPMMTDGGIPILSAMLGKGPGAGMALMFVLTGYIGSLTSLLWLRSKALRDIAGRPEAPETETVAVSLGDV